MKNREREKPIANQMNSEAGFMVRSRRLGWRTLTSVEGRTQGFFESGRWTANLNAVPANQYPRQAMAAPCATPVDRLHRRLWPLREHDCEISVTARTIAGKILCHQLSIGVKHSSPGTVSRQTIRRQLSFHREMHKKSSDVLLVE